MGNVDDYDFEGYQKIFEYFCSPKKQRNLNEVEVS